MSITLAKQSVYHEIGIHDADAMLVKANLAMRIGQIIKNKKLTQIEAAKKMEISQAKVSDLLNGRFRGISEMKMMACLNRLGQDVRIEIHRAKSSRHMGQMQVVLT